jgi:hypothetical protein
MIPPCQVLLSKKRGYTLFGEMAEAENAKAAAEEVRVARHAPCHTHAHARSQSESRSVCMCSRATRQASVRHIGETTDEEELATVRGGA